MRRSHDEHGLPWAALEAFERARARWEVAESVRVRARAYQSGAAGGKRSACALHRRNVGQIEYSTFEKCFETTFPNVRSVFQIYAPQTIKALRFF